MKTADQNKLSSSITSHQPIGLEYVQEFILEIKSAP